MTRIPNSLFVFALAAATACSDPPEPEKATDLIEAESDKKSESKGGLDPLPSGAIAVVNGKEISNEAFRSIYDRKIKKYEERGRDVPVSADRRYRKTIAERLIYQEVLRQEAATKGVEYDKEALAERLETQKRGIRDWEKHLERRGETEESLADMYVAELREKALLEKEGKLAISDEEVKAEYEKMKGNYKSDKPRIRASHVLIPIGPEERMQQRKAEGEDKPTDEQMATWDKEAKAKADEVYAKAKTPETDFAALAQEHSTGPSSGKGGDLGIFTADRMVKEFSDAAFKLKEGQVSKPVKTKFGYHVIKVTGKWGPGELPLEALQDQIQARLSMRKLHQGRRELRERLLSSYEITNNIEPTLGPDPRAGKGADVAKAKGMPSGHAKPGPNDGPGREASKSHGAKPEPGVDGRPPASQDGKPESTPRSEKKVAAAADSDKGVKKDDGAGKATDKGDAGPPH